VTMAINYAEKIPNNVDLSDNRTLQRALERWQPQYQAWWRKLGPEGFMENDVYLRTATSVDAKGWASYGASASATTGANRPGRRCRASTAPPCAG
jgi:benzoyl-CoA 2,3-dioxygenase component B